MAIRAFFRRGLIKKDALRRDQFRELVAFNAADVLMCPRERKLGASVMVKE
jgi:hypothetical protein